MPRWNSTFKVFPKGWGGRDRWERKDVLYRKHHCNLVYNLQSLEEHKNPKVSE